MDALEAYKNLLRELDKYESPSFSIKDFNYFFNDAISSYLTDNYGDFDVIQKDLDDIGVLIVYGNVLTSPLFPLPVDYRHCLGVKASITFIEDTLDNAKGDIVIIYPKRMQTNRKGYMNRNAYQEESTTYPTYQLDSTQIYIRAGDSVEITSVEIDYIKNPEEVFLNPDRTVDYTDPVNNTPLQFPKYVCLEIIKVCRDNILENIESGRYQTVTNENQLTKMKE